MNDQFNDKRLEELHETLKGINKSLGNRWFSFGKGLLYGFGSVLGAGLAIILIGWFLNVIGVIPALSNTATQWREAFQASTDAKSYIAPSTDDTTAQ